MANLQVKTETTKAARLQIAHNALQLKAKPDYYLEDFQVKADGSINVTYINKNDLDTPTGERNWINGVISELQLLCFISDTYSDHYCVSGYHELFQASIDATIFIEENMRCILVTYLNAGKEVAIC